jgi:PmbA/TldA metallopeptidase C-terminal domain
MTELSGKTIKHLLCCASLLLLAIVPAFGQDDVVMKAMHDELARSMSQLHLENLDKPYFIAYRVDETTTTSISATLGELTASNSYRNRGLSVQMRVGDYDLDNTNYFSPNSFAGRFGTERALPLDDDYSEIRRAIWMATDSQYKSAAAALAAKRSVLQHREGGSNLPDFMKLPPSTYAEKPAIVKVDTSALEKLAREVSAVFRDEPEILNSGVTAYVANSYTRYVSSEGTSYTRGEPMVFLNVGARTQATDGVPLDDAFQIYGRSMDALRQDEILTRARAMLSRLKALRTANSIDRYNGPVLFEGDGAGDVLSQVFAPAVVAARFPITDEPQFESQVQQILDQFGASLADRIGSRVMPDSFDLVDKPGAATYGSTPLMGAASFDDEGVAARETKLVENGRLMALLSTRVPTQQTKESTGNARSVGAAPWNLFLTARKPVTSDELRKQLLTMAKQRGYDYGIIVRDTGSAGMSGILRMAMQMASQNTGASAIGAYKVYADGHEELVRADINPLSLAAFKDIVAADDKPIVYSSPFIPLLGAILGAGRAPSSNGALVSYVVPALLFDEVLLKRPSGPTPKPPIVASPVLTFRNAGAK